MPKSVLVVAAHPDDEVLGCGGTISRHVDSGDSVFILLVCEGITSRIGADSLSSRNQLSQLRDSSLKASSQLGVLDTSFLSLPDNRLDSLNRLDVIQALEKHVTKTKPDIIYTHHSGDVNIDHQIISHSVITACRPFGEHIVRTILAFEVPSSTEWQVPANANCFAPNHFVNIDSYLENKLSALHFYHSEMRNWPHTRSYEYVKHLAHLRGAQVGFHAAEAFVVLRSIS